MASHLKEMANTSLLQKKRTRPGSPISSMITIMCILMTYMKQSSVRIMVLLGPIDHGRVFSSEINHSDLDGTDESNKEQIPSDSEDESEDGTRETTSIGSHAHRTILGLPPRGPLTLDDVKTA
jgi:hypothetical protein